MAVAREISQRELRNDSGEVMRQLDRGQSFVITRNGTPVGELTPLRRHRFVRAEAAMATFRGAPGIDAERFRADVEAVADQETTPRA
jgi:prevent-host-death family protein